MKYRLVACALALVLFGALPAVAVSAPQCLIAIDIGHHRQAPGATSARGVPEWPFNAALANRLHNALQADGLPSVLMNPDGNTIGLLDRPKAAQAAGATLFLSIHHDSVQPRYLLPWTHHGRELVYSDKFKGYGLFVSTLNPAFEESRRVAERIGDGLLAQGLHPSLHHAEAIPGENRPLLDARRGIYRYDDQLILKSAAMPALVLEAGVIINRDEELDIGTTTYQDEVIVALIGGLKEHCERVSAIASR